MRTIRTGLLAATLGATLAWGSAGAQETRPSRQTLMRAVVQLGDPDFGKREQAMQLLWRAGPEAEAILEEASKLDDAEVASRAKQILEDLSWGIRPDLPESVIADMRAYRTADPDRKQELVSAIQKLDKPEALVAVSRLAMADKSMDPQQRVQVFAGSAARAARMAARVIAADGSPEMVEDILRLDLEQDNVADAGADFTAWALTSGRVKQVSEKLEAWLKDPRWANPATEALAMLRRGTGDRAAALSLARQLPNNLLADVILIEQADWAALAKIYVPEHVLSGNLSQATFAGVVQQLAGHADAAAQMAGVLKDAARRELDNNLGAAQGLLAMGDVQQGMDLAAKIGDPAIRFQVFYLRQEYTRALEIAGQLLDTRSHGRDERNAILASMTRMNLFLGRNEKADEILRPLEEGALTRSDVRLLYRIVATLSNIDRRTAAMKLATDALRRIPAADFQRSMLDALYGERSERAGVLLTIMQGRAGKQDAATALGDVERLLTDGPKDGELDWLVKQVVASGYRISYCAAVAEVLRAEGHEKEAADLLKHGLEVSRQTATSPIPLGDQLTWLGKWQEAADAYRAAFAMSPTAPLAVFAGACAERAGDADTAQTLTNRGTRMLLGNAQRRIDLGALLLRAGFVREAAAQDSLAVRAGNPENGEPIEALEELALSHYRRGDFASAARLQQQAVMIELRMEMLLDESLNIPSLQRMYRWQTLAMLQAGKPKEALKPLELCMQLLPADVSMPIEAVPLLRKAGLTKEADALQAEAIAAQEANCRQFPDSPAMHNGMAWLLVRLRIDLDRALAEAQKAHELNPENLAIADTLAEAYFQKGNRAKALELIGQCIRREPENRRHWLVRARFEKGSSETDPPAEE